VISLSESVATEAGSDSRTTMPVSKADDEKSSYPWTDVGQKSGHGSGPHKGVAWSTCSFESNVF
jgi:hypothetical protein